MNALKVVADRVPEKSYYLTAGKVYELTLLADGHRAGDVFDDEGEAVFILLDGCSHLGGGNWRVVE